MGKIKKKYISDMCLEKKRLEKKPSLDQSQRMSAKIPFMFCCIKYDSKHNLLNW